MWIHACNLAYINGILHYVAIIFKKMTCEIAPCGGIINKNF